MVDFRLQRLNNRPVSGDSQATYWEIARCVGIGAIFVGLILTYAWLHMETLNINYELEQLKKENAKLGEMNAALRAEYSSLINPEKIDRQARALGLTSSNHAQVRIIQGDPVAPVGENVVAHAWRQKKTVNE